MAIELHRAQHDSDSAYLFIEDDGRVLRLQLDGSDVRIGRDQSNDIWIDNQQVRPQTCIVYARDGDHHLKVYDGAKVQLNGQPVRGLHRLYSGDRIGVGDRELLYGRDDVLPQVALGLTVMVDGDVAYGLVFRRNRVRLGRTDADLILSDGSVAERHLLLECYSDHGLYAFDLGSETGTWVNGTQIDERQRLYDGDTLQLGRVTLRLHLLPIEAHGLLLTAPLPEQPLVPIAAPKPMDRAPAQRHDPGAFSPARRQADGRPLAGGLMRPLHHPSAATADARAVAMRPAAPEPLSLSSLSESVTAVGQANDQPATEVGSLAQLARDGWQAMSAAHDSQQRQTAAPRRDSVPLPLPSAPRPAPEPALGFHEQHTEMLDTARVYEGLQAIRQRADDGDPARAPTTAVLDTSLPPAVAPVTRREREAAATRHEHLPSEPAAIADRHRTGHATGAFDRPQLRVAIGSHDGGPSIPRAEVADGSHARYRPGKASGAWDRANLQDDQPRVAPRPLSEAELAANPQWYNPRPGAEDNLSDDPDASRRFAIQREIDSSRRPPDDGGKGRS